MTHPQSHDELFAAAQNELSGRFLVWEPERSGPHSAVFNAHDSRSGERLFLHVVSRAAMRRVWGQGSEERFRQAVATAATLLHPGIVRVVSSGSTPSLEWYATHAPEGAERLSSILASKGALPAAELAPLTRQIADVLRYAHGRGVVHGHISPAVVLLTQEGHALVGEFCTRELLRRLLIDESRAHSPAPPAVVRGAISDALDDRRSLALLVHECLGRRARPSRAAMAEEQRPRAGDNGTGEANEPMPAGAYLVPLTAAEEERLSRAWNGDGDERLPSLAGLHATSEEHELLEPDEAVTFSKPEEGGNREQLVFLDESQFLPIGDPPAQRPRRWPLAGAIALTAGVTWWLATVVFSDAERQRTTDTVYIASFGASSGDAALASHDSDFSAPPPTDGSIALNTQLASVQTGNSAAARLNTPVAATSADHSAPAASGAASSNSDASLGAGGRGATVRGDPGRSGDSGARTRSSMPGVGAAGAPGRGQAATAVSSRANAAVDTSSAKGAAAAPARLFISSRPWGQLYVDGALIGTTPATNVSIPAGKHHIRVVRDGFQPFDREVSVAPGAVLRLIDIVLIRNAP